MFAFRYDLRRPAWSLASPSELYTTAVEQAAFIDRHGLGPISVSEHHASDDGYLPAPIVLAGALAGATSTAHVSLCAVIAPLAHPIRLAEDIAVLDLASGGRISVVLGLGYRREEHDLLDVEWAGRARRFDETIEVLVRAWTGEPFEWRGRTVRVLPRPRQEPHPLLFVGGSTVRAAERAARFGLHFLAAVRDPALVEAYETACRARGAEPGLALLPPDGPAVVHVAEDPDKAWAQVGRHLLHDVQAYQRWQPPGQRTQVTDGGPFESVEDLRAAGHYRIVTPEECAAIVREHGSAVLHPLVGGLPAELSWPSLQLLADRVAPLLAAGA